MEQQSFLLSKKGFWTLMGINTGLSSIVGLTSYCLGDRFIAGMVTPIASMTFGYLEDVLVTSAARYKARNSDGLDYF